MASLFAPRERKSFVAAVFRVVAILNLLGVNSQTFEEKGTGTEKPNEEFLCFGHASKGKIDRIVI
jgi:hypothetical protein